MKFKLKQNYQVSTIEPYMNSKQINYFKDKLIAIKMQMCEKMQETLDDLKNFSKESDILDRSGQELFRDMRINKCRYYKDMIDKSDAALRRIDKGTYGFCEITGMKIGLKRLEAIPYASLSVGAQELLEKAA